MSRLPRQPVLRVRGRVSGRIRAIPVRPIVVEGSTYLVSLPGESNWARNLRAAGTAALKEGRAWRTFRATEVFGPERASAVRTYLGTSTFGPTKRLLTERLPDPDDHPVFRVDEA